MTSPTRHILITGGTSGIGRALVEQYHREGWRVITCARSVEALTAAEHEFPGIITVPCDLADREERHALLRHVAESVDELDGLINNAGIQMSYAYATGADRSTDIELEIAVNLTAPVDLGQLFAAMLEHRDGFIANITSGLAYIPKGRSPLYAGTKAGLAHYTRSVRLQHPRVRFIEVVMPLVDTPLTAGRGSNKLPAAEAARQVRAGIASGRETVRVGKARLLPIMNRVAPGLLRYLMNRADSTDFHPKPARP